MDQRERSGELEELIRLQARSQVLTTWTALPVKVVEVNLAAMTVDVQPLIQAWVVDQLGAGRWVTLPLLINCPLVFPGGGGATLTFPVQADDEGLAVFSSRAIDNWWLTGEVSTQVELRAHALDDAFVLIGPRSQARLLQNINQTDAELRTDDGLTSIGVSLAGVVTIKAPAGVKIEGNLVVTGTLIHG